MTPRHANVPHVHRVWEYRFPLLIKLLRLSAASVECWREQAHDYYTHRTAPWPYGNIGVTPCLSTSLRFVSITATAKILDRHGMLFPEATYTQGCPYPHAGGSLTVGVMFCVSSQKGNLPGGGAAQALRTDRERASPHGLPRALLPQGATATLSQLLYSPPARLPAGGWGRACAAASAIRSRQAEGP